MQHCAVQHSTASTTTYFMLASTRSSLASSSASDICGSGRCTENLPAARRHPSAYAIDLCRRPVFSAGNLERVCCTHFPLSPVITRSRMSRHDNAGSVFSTSAKDCAAQTGILHGMEFPLKSFSSAGSCLLVPNQVGVITAISAIFCNSRGCGHSSTLKSLPVSTKERGFVSGLNMASRLETSCKHRQL